MTLKFVLQDDPAWEKNIEMKSVPRIGEKVQLEPELPPTEATEILYTPWSDAHWAIVTLKRCKL